jgi:hypothetical protein
MQADADVVTGAGHQAGELSQGTTRFIDESVGLSVGIDRSYDGISGLDQTSDTDLSKFLSRPVKIASFQWLQSDSIGTTRTIAPWHLFWNDTRVKYKVNNFAFMQCKLKIKVLINASPFYYGAMIGSYIPVQGVTPSTIVNDSANRWFIPTSQRPHMWIFPQGSKADEMTLPFFYHKNFVDIQSAADLTAMGQLNFVNYTALASANGASGVGVNVQVYAWAEDVKLSGPSVGLAMQGDEYGNGVVSAPASAIASAASWFEKIPIIGRFATATRIGASAVSSIASMFGFTNVPVISDTQSYRPSPFPQLASTTIAYPAEKLTLDPKNELTVDPSILGLPPDDEMAIGNLITRESFLCTATWTSTNAVDDILFSARVNPVMYDNDNGTSQKLYNIPMSWIAALFKGWRGDIIFRFKFIATPYHKGRVRISYDPSGYAATNILNDVNTANVVMTQIIDLGEESDVELRIPYQQATAFQQIRPDYTAASIPFSLSLTPTFTASNIFDNGTICMRVLTNLTAPVSTASVPVMIFVRAAENFEFANPSDVLPTGFSYFQPQADVYGDPSAIVAGSASSTHADRYLVNYGECVKSLRQVLRRSSLSLNLGCLANTTSANTIQIFRFSRFPLYYGFDPLGLHSGQGIVVDDTFPFNFVKTTPFTWIAPAFVAHRGSMQWTFNVDSVNPVRHIRVVRANQSSTPMGYLEIPQALRGSLSEQSAFFASASIPGAGGQALTSQRTNQGLTVQLPNYTRFRWQSTNPRNSSALPAIDGSDIDAHNLEIHVANSSETTTAPSQTTWCYQSIGTDYGLYFFLNVPTMWIYASAISPI